MTATNNKVVLVFGATGKVGSTATAAAMSREADVHIALRDPAKPLPTSALQTAFANSNKKHKADLSDPASVLAATRASGATAAFVYALHESADGMRATFAALKEGGIKHVVLLSSYTLGVSKEAEAKIDKNNLDFIQTFHARAEESIKAAGFESHTFVRPGSFASNSVMWWKPMIADPSLNGNVYLPFPDAPAAHIVDNDIGDVAGALLVADTPTPEIVPLIGPQHISHRDSVAIIAKAIGRDLKVVPVSVDQFRETTIKFVPPPIVDALIKYWTDASAQPDDTSLAANVQRYAGRPAMTFEQWVAQNKAAFE
ncbi:hypothetical protein BDZ88DRAFT_427771 [Geranomyces variabilis]|nr:hypothetical protein BDZ88DRAFT_427771 [Geranomyces variabilis]KAJ3132576.1 hypothetical protein HDU90_006788 [Geranomyces variabilis]